jgi:hypothetical protein
MLKGIKKELGEAGDYQIFLLNTKDPAETEAQAEKVRAFLL